MWSHSHLTIDTRTRSDCAHPSRSCVVNLVRTSRTAFFFTATIKKNKEEKNTNRKEKTLSLRYSTRIHWSLSPCDVSVAFLGGVVRALRAPLAIGASTDRRALPRAIPSVSSSAICTLTAIRVRKVYPLLVHISWVCFLHTIIPRLTFKLSCPQAHAFFWSCAELHWTIKNDKYSIEIRLISTEWQFLVCVNYSFVYLALCKSARIHTPLICPHPLWMQDRGTPLCIKPTTVSFDVSKFWAKIRFIA